MIDLDELECLAKAAEPGPYRIDENGDVISSHGIHFSAADLYFSNANLKYFIAANPQTVLDLIERVRLAEKEVSVLREEMDKWKPFLNAHGLNFYSPPEGEA